MKKSRIKNDSFVPLHCKAKTKGGGGRHNGKYSVTLQFFFILVFILFILVVFKKITLVGLFLVVLPRVTFGNMGCYINLINK